MRRREFVAGALLAPARPTRGWAAPARHGVPEWDLEGQRRRRNLIYRLHRRDVALLFDGQGKWIGKSAPQGPRERYWSALPLVSAAETHSKGNAIVLETCGNTRRAVPALNM